MRWAREISINQMNFVKISMKRMNKYWNFSQLTKYTATKFNSMPHKMNHRSDQILEINTPITSMCVNLYCYECKATVNNKKKSACLVDYRCSDKSDI